MIHITDIVKVNPIILGWKILTLPRYPANKITAKGTKIQIKSLTRTPNQ